jgi:hypothetical protein
MVDKLKVDEIPGEYEKRVFIGGNYDLLPTLRKIGGYVEEYGLQPIIAFDYNVSNIHDDDLRLLHNCKYAIFEVTKSAGEIMELERCRDYRTQVLVVFQTREKYEIPAQVSSMILATGFTRRGYAKFDHLKDCVKDFLFEEDGLFDRYLEVFGYKFEALEASIKVNEDGTTNNIYKYQGFEVVDEDLTLTQEGPHYFDLFGRGKFRKGLVFSTNKEDKVIWGEERRTDSFFKGYIRFNGGLKRSDGSVSYNFKFDAKGDVCFTKEEFEEEYPNDDFPYEYFAITIKSPIETLKVDVSFFKGYQVILQPIAFHGLKREEDAVTGPSTIFKREDNQATLIVKRPRIFYSYLIYWEPIPKEEYEKRK